MPFLPLWLVLPLPYLTSLFIRSACSWYESLPPEKKAEVLAFARDVSKELLRQTFESLAGSQKEFVLSKARDQFGG